jgi:glutaminase
MYFDPVETTDLYTRQCAINVHAKNLGVMAATLANGGTNPITKKRVVSPETAMHTLAVMATAGLYDNSGIWLFNTGLPARVVSAAAYSPFVLESLVLPWCLLHWTMRAKALRGKR